MNATSSVSTISSMVIPPDQVSIPISHPHIIFVRIFCFRSLYTRFYALCCHCVSQLKIFPALFSMELNITLDFWCSWYFESTEKNQEPRVNHSWSKVAAIKSKLFTLFNIINNNHASVSDPLSVYTNLAFSFTLPNILNKLVFNCCTLVP